MSAMVTSPGGKKNAKGTVMSSFEMELMNAAEGENETVDLVDLKRPPVDLATLGKEQLIFQQIEIDHYMTSEHLTPAQAAFNSPFPVMTLYGITREQHSVLCHVHGFLPYLYVPAPWPSFSPTDVLHFKAVLDNLLKTEERNTKNVTIQSVELVQKQSIYGFSSVESQAFLKISLFNPNHMASLKRIIESGIEFAGKVYTLNTYESNIQHVIRFMIDSRITGMSWIKINPNHFAVREQSKRISHCQIEIDVFDWTSLNPLPLDGEGGSIAPLRILSFDIECSGRKGVFPDPKIDPVIQIANVIAVQGSSKSSKIIFTLGSCANIVGAEVRSFEEERELLLAWTQLLQEYDPDVIIGYNIMNFDFAYLLDRANALRINSFSFIGRLHDSSSKAKDTHFSSRAYGTRESKAVNIDGRITFDLLQVFQRDFKLRSYSLNNVSAQFLGEQKEDVHYSIISELQAGDSETRRRLAVYCLKDAVLPLRLMDKLMLFINYVELARVTGVPFNFMLSYGQQIKVLSQLYRKAADENFIIPSVKVDAAEEQYEGATVIEPSKGYYDMPIATLDFTSLYPSIMIAHNLCYTTLLSPEQLKDMPPESYERTPSGDYFVKSSVRAGLLPRILDDLIKARKKAKTLLKTETDPIKQGVYNARQLALKISTNSVYGFTGATVGKLPCIPISQSTTAYGRVMIEETKRLIEEKFCIKNGYPSDAKVIYGDTDSVMVNFGQLDLNAVMQLGREGAEFVTGHFVKPINLDFEKAYFPFLLINKKRYAGLYWTNPEKYDKMDTKGIETVRRDNCKLVQTVIDTCLRKILIERDVEGAKNYAKQVIADLLQNKIDLSQLVISKALSKSGEDYAAKQAHVELAERMRKRDPGSAPALGDRVAYVIVKSSKGAAAYEKSEDPIYVLENNLPIDTKYYLENQLSKPLLRIFEPIISNPDEILSGEHTRIVHVPSNVVLTGAMKSFVKQSYCCLSCKATLQTNSPVCSYCKDNVYEIYQKSLDTQNHLENAFSRLWSQCQRCQGDLHHDVLCTSRDCPIFYMRKKIQKDLKESTETLERFNQPW